MFTIKNDILSAIKNVVSEKKPLLADGAEYASGCFFVCSGTCEGSCQENCTAYKANVRK